MEMDSAKKVAQLCNHLKDIKSALNQTDGDKFEIIDLAYCLRVLRDVNEKDFETIENGILEMLTENKERLETMVHNL